MHDHRPPSSYSTDELLQLVAVRRSRLIERATILKRELRVLAAQLTACEQSVDELDRTERHLLAENVARLKRKAEETLPE
jgi:hypothetical protein